MFQQSIISQHIAQIPTDEIAQKWAQFQAIFHNADKQANIRASKEEQYQEGFLRDLFVAIFGYTLNPEPNYNLTTEQKNETDSKKADGAILHDGKVIAVIELKGTDTRDLNKIVAQAFGYKNNNANCRYVIISNFQKIRFYIQNTTEFLEFDLFTLNEEQFKLLYLIFKREHLQSGLPEKIKAQSLSAEEAITKQLYADYAAFKRDLFADLIAHNPQHDKLFLFQKAQKLLDRFLFIFFAEDCKLLPPNLCLNILNDWHAAQKLRIKVSLYDYIKQYFGYLDTGDSELNIFAYNGGLFKPNPELDALIISDDVLEKHCRKIAQYDFASQIDVNILGHIFEHSLNEIDEIHAELNGEKVDKKQTKRKKDGVFYTPKYITQYIVQNTVGKLCADKKAELGLTEDYLNSFRLPEKGMKKDTIAKLLAAAQAPLQKIEDYREWLLDITICDPACGSGAFLNEALNFLIAEHTLIDEWQSQLAGGSMVYQNIEHAILERNLYGVDINEESVEIAKLSLWLRTAQRHRKLNNLNNNIVCGNSLISDKNVAGAKAFDFQAAFPQVFKRGGFDVIIGNPPYGATLSEADKIYIEQNFKSFEYQLNTYVIFYEQGLNLLKEKGLLGYITPATFTYGHYFKNIRSIFQQYKQLFINKYFYEVFEDADIGDAITWIIQKTENDKSDIALQLWTNPEENQQTLIKSYAEIVNADGTYNLNKSSINIHANSKNCISLGEIANIIVGVKPYQKGKGKPEQTKEIVESKIFTAFDVKPDESYTQCIIGKDFHRYKFIDEPNMYIQYGEWLAEPRQSAPFFDDEKIIIRQTSDRLICHLDTLQRVNLNNVYNVGKKNNDFALKYLLCLLNSKLMDFLYQNISQEKGRTFAEVKKIYLEKLPIKNISLAEQRPFIELADKMLQLNRDFQAACIQFERLFCRRFAIEKPSKALLAWHEGTFTDFVDALKKHKIKLSLNDEMEWETTFNAQQAKVAALKKSLADTDAAIDKRVFELYGLSAEEIAIVQAA